MPRRSERIQSLASSSTAQHKSNLVEVGSDEEEYDEEQEEEEVGTRPHKRAKKSPPPKYTSRKGKGRIPAQFRKVKGRMGLLERLAKDVPLDIIFEIFGYLNPGDLLRLARTTRELRSILMSKSSAIVWRRAREGVEPAIPPLPSDLNEPQYAYLLYENTCHFCGGKRCETVYWSFRLRSCRKCALKTFVGLTATGELPPSFPSEVFPTEIMTGSGYRRRHMTYHLEITERYIDEYNDIQNEEERKEWIANKLEERHQMMEHNELCQKWRYSRYLVREEEMENVRKQRRKDILARLDTRLQAVALSYTTHDMYDAFSGHELVFQAKKLTERGWNSIKGQLVAWLEEQEAVLIERLRRRIIFSRYKLLNELYVQAQANQDLRIPFPRKYDVLGSKFFENVIYDTDMDVHITSDDFMKSLPIFVEQWRSAKFQELAQHLQSYLPGVSASDLSLATAVFECTKCSGALMDYQQIFHHQCCFQIVSSGGRMKDLDASGGIWTPQPLALSTRSRPLITQILEACSLDPATATVQDLHDANPLIECQTCSVTNISRYFTRWPSVIVDPFHSDHTFAINSFGDETQRILACEPYDNFFIASCCAHCHERSLNHAGKCYTHLFTRHADTVMNANTGSGAAQFPLSMEDLRLHCYKDPTMDSSFWGSNFVYFGSEVS